MCIINVPNVIESACGLNPYWSAGIASATATVSFRCGSRCFEYSPAGSSGDASACAPMPKNKSVATHANALPVLTKPPRSLHSISGAGQRLVLRGAQRYHREPSDSHQRRIGEQLVLLDL